MRIIAECDVKGKQIERMRFLCWEDGWGRKQKAMIGSGGEKKKRCGRCLQKFVW